MPMARCAIGGSGCTSSPPYRPHEHVAAALAQRRDAERGGRRRADEIDRAGDACELAAPRPPRGY